MAGADGSFRYPMEYSDKPLAPIALCGDFPLATSQFKAGCVSGRCGSTTTKSPRMTSNLKRQFPVLFVISLFLTACSASDGATQTSSSTATSSPTSSSSTSSKAPSSSTGSEAIEPAIVQAPTVEPAPIEQAPVVEQAPVATLPSAISIWAPAGTGYQCPGTDAFVYDPANCTSANLGGDPNYENKYPGGQGLSNIPYADGGTCPAYKCGYGTDSYGNPNPSSGELQAIHGCEDGYITDAFLCDAVNSKAEQYDW